MRRFGPAAAGWHERARGIDRRPLRPRPRALRIDRHLYGEGEATSEEAVLFALRVLGENVVDDLGAAGKRAGRLVLSRSSAKTARCAELITRVAQPTAVQTTLFELLRARLEGIVLESPVVRAASRCRGTRGWRCLRWRCSRPAIPDPDALGVVLARLDAALGGDRALRPRLVAGPRIERRFALDTFTLEALTTTVPTTAGSTPLPATTTLQLRLVEPQPVAVRIAGNAPPRFVGTPAALVVAFAGPWRVDEGWWASATGSGEALVRDEYDVLLDDGSLVRLAREGECWSIHGIYD